jgi:predicted Zn-dependent protease
VTVIDDATIPHRGLFLFDDEGTPERGVLVENGISRATCATD